MNPIEAQSSTRTANPNRFGFGRLFVALAVVAGLIAACADDDGERRFANDPLPTEEITGQPTPGPTTVAFTVTAAALASPLPIEQLLTATGGAAHLFVVSADEVFRVELDGSRPTSIDQSKGSQIVAHAASPDGTRLAVIHTDKAGNAALRVLAADGEELLDLAVAPTSVGTPAAQPIGAYDIDWDAAGQRLLVARAAGGILEVNFTGGSVRELVSAGAAASPRAVAWSPNGGAIAFVDAGVDGAATGLYVASTDALPVDPVAVIRPIAGRSRQIVDIDWVPMAGILYAERSPTGDLSVGGDLFSVSPSGGMPRLVIATRDIAQVSAIVEFEVSPDGRALAYAVESAQEGGSRATSFHIAQVDGPTRAPVGAGITGEVVALSWTSDGLAWAGLTAGAAGDKRLVVQRVEADASVVTVYADPERASPPASPIASPAASPIGLPE